MFKRSVFLLAMLACLTLNAAEEARVLNWQELIPKEETDLLRSEKPSAMEQMLGGRRAAVGVVATLNDTKVRVPGFVVPLESDEAGNLAEFFLVPYFGACIHVPPPPANQIIYVKVEEGFYLDNLWEPFWIEGVLTTKTFAADLGEAAYTIVAEKIEKYEY